MHNMAQEKVWRERENGKNVLFSRIARLLRYTSIVTSQIFTLYHSITCDEFIDTRKSLLER